MLSWASPPGAPPDHAPSEPRERGERSATNLRFGRSIRWPSPRVLRHRSPEATDAPRSRGRKFGATSPPRHAAVGPDRLHRRRSGGLADLTRPGGRRPPGLDPRRPASPSDTRQHDSPEGARTAAASEVSKALLRRVGTTAEAIDPFCSPAFREVGGRRRGGPRCRWVDQVWVRLPGSGDQSEAPAPAWGRELPPTVTSPGIRRAAVAPHRCDTSADPSVGG